ncbi:hypothetical protein O6H91_06G041100 [Diphasiastrum complanatum]|uniref:Uncharacterized protein n=1 Tax=Diphasiastrum complanatum TaxID=34168 RepID=A0ACC2DD01_DIPCM|nr:hypothetical protein O6H91_06G041100 [Diphasiastrum complanatum]
MTHKRLYTHGIRLLFTLSTIEGGSNALHALPSLPAKLPRQALLHVTCFSFAVCHFLMTRLDLMAFSSAIYLSHYATNFLLLSLVVHSWFIRSFSVLQWPFVL